MRSRRVDALIAFSAVGVAIAGYLTFVALDPSAEALCSGVGDCHRVQNSEYATVGDVPVALLGLAMYVTLLGLTVARRAGWAGLGPGTPRLLRTWTFALALGGMLYSAYLTYLELFVIDAICEWCVVSAAVVTVIALLAVPDVRATASADAA